MSWEWDEATKDVKLTVKQTQKVDDMTPLFRTSAEIEIALPGETLTRRFRSPSPKRRFTSQSPSARRGSASIRKDWLLKKLSFDKSKEELLDQLANDKNVICRLQAMQGLDSQKGDPQVAAALMTAAAKDSFWGDSRGGGEGDWQAEWGRGSQVAVSRREGRQKIARPPCRRQGAGEFCR